MNVVDVIIIGAGAAGLTAGKTLQGARTYRILEASSVIGGRLKKLEGFASYPIDLGGEWISVDRNTLNDIAGEDPGESTIVFNPEYFQWDGSSFVSGTLPADGPDTDFKFVGSTWFDFFNDHVAPSVREQIVFNCQVDYIGWGSSPVIVECADGRNYEASQVIVTVPIKILQGSTITWNPSLPDSTESAINGINFLDGIKVFLMFSTKFYKDAFQYFSYDPPGDVLWYDSTFGQSTSENILGYFAAGQPATELVGLTDSEIIADLLSRLDAAYSNQATASYIDGRVQNWNLEPYIGGAYSFDVTDALSELQTCLSNRVFFAGEAVPVDGNNGFAHSAALSGQDAANKILCLTSCFSESATVQVLYPSHPEPVVTRMKDLQVGDLILVDGNHTFEPVYAFAHWDPTKWTQYLRIQTEGGLQELEVSQEHMVYVQGKDNPVRAQSIRPGDLLQAPHQAMGTKVSSVDVIRKQGMYAPLTESGFLIVDGIQASSYASLQLEADEFVEFSGGLSTGISQHYMVHMALSPYRMICLCALSSTTPICHEYDKDGMPIYISKGIELAQWADRLPLLTQIILFLVFATVILPFWTAEYLVGPTMMRPVFISFCCLLLAGKILWNDASGRRTIQEQEQKSELKKRDWRQSTTNKQEESKHQ